MRDPSLVVGNLYVGSAGACARFDGVRFVVHEGWPGKQPPCDCNWRPIAGKTPDFGANMPVVETDRFLDICHEINAACDRDNVLVHCHGGVERSPLTVYGVLRVRGYSDNDAWEVVSKAHPIAQDRRHWLTRLP